MNLHSRADSVDTHEGRDAFQSVPVDSMQSPWLVFLLLQGAESLSPVVIKIERASRTLAATFVYEGLIQGREPLDLFDDRAHLDFWFDQGQAAIAAELEVANVDTDWVADSKKPIEKPEQKFNSPLLAARAERARKTVQLPPPTLQTRVPVPEGAVSDHPWPTTESYALLLYQRAHTQHALLWCCSDVHRPRMASLRLRRTCGAAHRVRWSAASWLRCRSGVDGSSVRLTTSSILSRPPTSPLSTWPSCCSF